MPKTFGKYLLLRRLATGGMGEIFLARPNDDARLEERLVIKRILPHLAEDSEFRDMFLDEARIATQLNHPNLVRIFEVGEVGESIYLAMEFVHGEDLRSTERASKLRGEPLPYVAATRIVAAAAAGLAHAHAVRGPDGKLLNLVHRDISPQNILVGFDGSVKLIDFGVAKAAGVGQPTVTGVLKGKCAYMSPEQAAGDAIDARSDVFSLGVVWWELLTARRLFKGSSDQMTMRLVQGCQVPPPTRLNPALPPGVDAVIAKVLAKKPADRYPDANAFHDALVHLLDEQGFSQDPTPQAALLKELFPERLARGPEAQTEEAVADAETSTALPGAYRTHSLPSIHEARDPFSPNEDDHTVTVTRTVGGLGARRWWIAAGVAILILTFALLARSL